MFSASDASSSQSDRPTKSIRSRKATASAATGINTIIGHREADPAARSSSNPGRRETSVRSVMGAVTSKVSGVHSVAGPI